MLTIEPPSTPSISAHVAALSKPGLSRFLIRARKAIGLSGEVDVLLASDSELKSLNRAYRGKNKATDVLSFPTPPEIAAEHAGDLAISLETAARQAAVYGHSLEIEIKVLLLHGLLHLSGEDHETDGGVMAARESELRSRLKLPVSLIDRVTNPGKQRSATPQRASHQPKSSSATPPKVPSRPKPSLSPSKKPSSRPKPSLSPSNKPSSRPKPSLSPSKKPSSRPKPSLSPSKKPSSRPKAALFAAAVERPLYFDRSGTEPGRSTESAGSKRPATKRGRA